MIEFFFPKLTEAVQKQIFLDGFLVGCILCILLFTLFTKDSK